ncbi:hypothetical protein F5146DRAFT_169423 [Armillaria mellea]|nr:hypothetical protein F5146DRAFT_169423 [Armillaria mellea]
MEKCSWFQNHISHRGDPSCHLLADHFSHAPSRNKIIRYHMPHPGFFLLSLFSAFDFSFFWASGYTRSHEPLTGSEPHCMAWPATSNRPPVNLYRLTASSVRNCVFMVLYVHTASFATRNFDDAICINYINPPFIDFLTLRTFLHRFRIPIVPDHITITYILCSLRISRLVIIPPGFMNTYEIFCRSARE